MEITKIIIEYKDGSQLFTENHNEIEILSKTIIDHGKLVVWRRMAGISALRNKYFALLNELVEKANTGYDKTELHEAIKPIIMRKFKDFPQYFSTGVPEYSTKNLTSSGWGAMIDQLKVRAEEIFGYIFK